MTEYTYNVIKSDNGVPIKAWTKGVPLEDALTRASTTRPEVVRLPSLRDCQTSVAGSMRRPTTTVCHPLQINTEAHLPMRGLPFSMHRMNPEPLLSQPGWFRSAILAFHVLRAKTLAFRMTSTLYASARPNHSARLSRPGAGRVSPARSHGSRLRCHLGRERKRRSLRD
jgi:hypothetical protein